MAAQTHEGWRGWWPSILVLVVVLEALLVVYLLRPHSGPFVLSPGDPLTRDGVAMMMICKPYGWHGTPDHTARYYLEPDYALAERGNWTKRDRGDCVMLYHHDGGEQATGPHRDSWRQDRPLH
jgi:hypothetical protein